MQGVTIRGKHYEAHLGSEFEDTRGPTNKYILQVLGRLCVVEESMSLNTLFAPKNTHDKPKRALETV